MRIYSTNSVMKKRIGPKEGQMGWLEIVMMELQWATSTSNPRRLSHHIIFKWWDIACLSYCPWWPSPSDSPTNINSHSWTPSKSEGTKTPWCGPAWGAMLTTSHWGPTSYKRPLSRSEPSSPSTRNTPCWPSGTLPTPRTFSRMFSIPSK